MSFSPVGPQGTPLSELTDGDAMKDYFAANVFSVMLLNAAFLERIKKQEQVVLVKYQILRNIINITNV